MAPADATTELRAFVARVEQRVQDYLASRPDKIEQTDHLRHVADRTRSLYYTELKPNAHGLTVCIQEREDYLIEACGYSHDIGKWIPREDLEALVPDDPDVLACFFTRLEFTPSQSGLFELGVRRRLA